MIFLPSYRAFTPDRRRPGKLCMVYRFSLALLGGSFLCVAGLSCSLFKPPFILNNPVDPELGYVLEKSAGEGPFENSDGIPGPRGIVYHPGQNVIVTGADWRNGYYVFPAGVAGASGGIYSKSTVYSYYDYGESFEGNIRGLCLDRNTGGIYFITWREIGYIDEPGASPSVWFSYENIDLRDLAVDADGTMYLLMWDHIEQMWILESRSSTAELLSRFDVNYLDLASISVSENYIFGLSNAYGAIFLLNKNTARPESEIYYDEGSAKFFNIDVFDGNYYQSNLHGGSVRYDPGTGYLTAHVWNVAPVLILDPENTTTPLFSSGGDYADFPWVSENAVWPVNENLIFIVENRTGTIVEYPSMRIIHQNPELAAEEAYEFSALAVGSDDYLYAIDPRAARLTRYSADLGSAEIIDLSEGPGAMDWPERIVAAGDDLLLSQHDIIRRFATDGTFVDGWWLPDGRRCDTLTYLPDGRIIVFNVETVSIYELSAGGIVEGPAEIFLDLPVSVESIRGAWMDNTPDGTIFIALHGKDWSSVGILDIMDRIYSEVWEPVSDPDFAAYRKVYVDEFKWSSEWFFWIEGFCVVDDYYMWINFPALSNVVRLTLKGDIMGSLSVHPEINAGKWTPGEISNFSRDDEQDDDSWWQYNTRDVEVDTLGNLFTILHSQILLFSPE